jgi:hypothetical protein
VPALVVGLPGTSAPRERPCGSTAPTLSPIPAPTALGVMRTGATRRAPRGPCGTASRQAEPTSPTARCAEATVDRLSQDSESLRLDGTHALKRADARDQRSEAATRSEPAPASVNQAHTNPLSLDPPFVRLLETATKLPLLLNRTPRALGPRRRLGRPVTTRGARGVSSSVPSASGAASCPVDAMCLLPVCGRRINNDPSMIELASPHRRPVQRHLEECSHYRPLFAQGGFVERQDQVVGVQ